MYIKEEYDHVGFPWQCYITRIGGVENLISTQWLPRGYHKLFVILQDWTDQLSKNAAEVSRLQQQFLGNEGNMGVK